jgi:hypothetical protein
MEAGKAPEFLDGLIANSRLSFASSEACASVSRFAAMKYSGQTRRIPHPAGLFHRFTIAVAPFNSSTRSSMWPAM